MVETKFFNSGDFSINMKTNDNKTVIISQNPDKEEIRLELFDSTTGKKANIVHLDKRDLEYLMRFISSSKDAMTTKN